QNWIKAGFGRRRMINVAEDSEVDPCRPDQPIEMCTARYRPGVAREIAAEAVRVIRTIGVARRAAPYRVQVSLGEVRRNRSRPHGGKIGAVIRHLIDPCQGVLALRRLIAQREGRLVEEESARTADGLCRHRREHALNELVGSDLEEDSLAETRKIQPAMIVGYETRQEMREYPLKALGTSAQRRLQLVAVRAGIGMLERAALL